jgi:outer membrane protein assembly factor BamB
MRESDRLLPVTARFAVAFLCCVLALSATSSAGQEEGEQMLAAKRIKGRPAKLLHQALYAKDGRLGFLDDIDDDGSDDFVHLVQTGGNDLSFRIMSLLDAEPRINVPLGKGYPAGLGMVNLDDDEDLEFIAAYGSRRDRLTQKALMVTASAITSALISAHTFPQTGTIHTVTYVGAPAGLDLQNVVALDHDGTILWARNLLEKGSAGEWDNVRFRMLVPLEERGPVTIVLTNNVGNQVLGLSGDDGTTAWTTQLEGDIPAAKWASAGLIDDGKILPVFFEGNFLTVLDPRDGTVILSDRLEMAVSAFPAWVTFGEGSDEGVLVFGGSQNVLQMISLATGDTLWSQQVETVRTVLPIDEQTFAVVWRNGIKKFSADGELLQDAPTPDKVKTVFDPVFKDINDDGSMEFVYVSGKKVVCWNPQEDRVLWRESLASFVGGANPVALYDEFYDLNGDGWLDVPAATGGGAGRWLSGKTGQVILETGAAFENPLVGDWDGNGKLDLFWWNNWWEIEPSNRGKKGKS